MNTQKERFFDEEGDGVKSGLVTLLYIRYAFYRSLQWGRQRLSPEDTRFADKLGRLRSAIDDAKKVRFKQRIIGS